MSAAKKAKESKKKEPSFAAQMRELSPVDLEKRLRESRLELLNLRLRRQTGQVEKTHTLRQKRKDIARMETVLTEKKKSAAVAAAS